jgi:hypothetical protein
LRVLIGIFIFICSPFFLKGQVNGYARVNAISGTTLYLGSTDETYDSFDNGDDIVIMQMQDDVIGSNTSDNSSFGNLSSIQSAGLYEIRQISGSSSSTGNSIWKEEFTLSNGTTSDAGATAWSRTFSSGGSGSSSSVNGNQFRSIRGTTVWTSETIDISQYYDVDVSVDISESGTLESSDCITVEYSLDGGTATEFTTNGSTCDDYSARSATVSNLNGSTLQIIITSVSDGSSETHYWDDVDVTGDQRTLTLSSSLTNTYNTGINESVQAVTFPTLGSPNYTTTGNITAVDWNGEYGGVIAFQVTGVLTLAHNITANGQGFRGGDQDNNGTAGSCDGTTYRIGNDLNYAYKGEGIYRNTTATYEKAKGKIINGGGGGNEHNGGGGGGGNYTAGGDGGPGWNGGSGCSPTGGGTAGISLSTYISASRVFMGGGAGAGEANNSYNTTGGDGGGIILLKAETLQTTGSCGGRTISANGSGGNSHGGNDGTGGGGAGGTVVMHVTTYSIGSSCALTIAANGGDGADVGHSAIHGAGGGGGQGAVIYNGAQPTTNVTTNTVPGDGGCNNTSCSSSASSGSGTANTSIISNDVGPLPVELIRFTARLRDGLAMLEWETASEFNSDYFEVQRLTDLDEDFWESACQLSAAGYSTTPLPYACSDPLPLLQKTYYRLIINDFNGHKTYSSIVVIGPETTPTVGTFTVYPVPARKGLNVSFDGDLSEFRHTIYDATGRLHYLPWSEINAHLYTIEVEELPEGIYTLNVEMSGKIESRRFVISK